MNHVMILILILTFLIFYLHFRKYRNNILPSLSEIPKRIKKAMKRNEDNPNGLIELAKAIRSRFTNKPMIETFGDIKDIRYGKIGCSNCGNGDTSNKWIKLARINVNGPWKAKGFTLEVYPKLAQHGSSRQTIVCLVRNTDKDLEAPYISLTTHNESFPNTKSIKDVNLIRVSGSGTNNIVEVWAQLASWWANAEYSMFYLFGIETNDTIVTSLSEMIATTALPGGSKFGLSDIYSPEYESRNSGWGVAKELQNTNDGVDAHTIMGLKNATNGRSVWFMNSSKRTYDGGPNTATIRNDSGDMRVQGATPWNTEKGILVQANTGNVGINTKTPRGTLDVNNGDIRIGRWSIRDESGNLVFRDMIAQAAGRDKRILILPEQTYNITQDKMNMQQGEVYLRLNCGGGGAGTKTQKVIFSTPFTNIPKVYVSLKTIDYCNDGKGLRVTCAAQSITKEGFEVVISTWADTQMWGAAAAWVAYA